MKRLNISLIAMRGDHGAKVKSSFLVEIASDQACFCLRIVLALGIVFALGILYFGLISVAINQQFGKL